MTVKCFFCLNLKLKNFLSFCLSCCYVIKTTHSVSTVILLPFFAHFFITIYVSFSFFTTHLCNKWQVARKKTTFILMITSSLYSVDFFYHQIIFIRFFIVSFFLFIIYFFLIFANMHVSLYVRSFLFFTVNFIFV